MTRVRESSFGEFLISAAGNSPPVRDRPPDKSKQKRAENIRRNLTSPLGKTHRVKGGVLNFSQFEIMVTQPHDKCQYSFC